MNGDEDYGFDVAGFIHVPRALSADEVAAWTEAADADGGLLEWPALQEHPVLASYLESLCGPGFATDQPPALVPDAPGGQGAVPLSAGAADDRRRLRYANHGDTRECKGVGCSSLLRPRPKREESCWSRAATTGRRSRPPGFSPAPMTWE